MKKSLQLELMTVSSENTQINLENGIPLYNNGM